MSELSNCVCAFVNKKAGKPFPNKPTINIGIICFFSKEKSLFQTNGRRLSQAMPILSCANSRSLNTTKPFFINMKELPQMNAKRIIKAQ